MTAYWPSGLALAAGLAAFAAQPANAQQTASTVPVSFVLGLANGDLLNIRASASPVAKVEARLPNGASVRNYGCNLINGYQWCEVEDATSGSGARGWTPGRYLTPIEPIEGEAGDQLAMAAPGDLPPVTGEASPDAAAKADALQPMPDISARFGDSPAAEKQGATDPGKTAAEDAYRLAFAANAATASGEDAAASVAAPVAENPAAPAPEHAAAPPALPPVTSGQAAAAVQPPADVVAPSGEAAQTTAAMEQAREATQDTTAAGQLDDAVPLPTPRPGATRNALSGAQADPQATVEPATQLALADPAPQPARPFDATGDIPCARYIGQPMTRCAVGVARNGDGKADVTVTWPDGGTRTISFYGGEPAGADSRSQFRFTREGDLNMIRVGVSERFEITDALAFGD